MSRRATHIMELLGQEPEDGWSATELAEATGQKDKSVCRSLRALERRGLAQRTGNRRWRITDAGREALNAPGGFVLKRSRPRKAALCFTGTLQSRLWRAMRMTKKFSVDDLVLRAAGGNEANPRNSASRYLNALERAGYVVRLSSSAPHKPR
ncbi:MAG TPA: helix-turn-helix domain-containing protein, partial [bacterium]